MVAGLTARLDVTHLLALEELDQLGDCLVNAETLLARMHRRNIRPAQPLFRVAISWRVRAIILRRASFRRRWLIVRVALALLVGAFGRVRRVMCDVRFDLRESLADL